MRDAGDHLELVVDRSADRIWTSQGSLPMEFEHRVREIQFTVYGHPMPKGSKTRMPNGMMIDAAPSRAKDPEKRKEQRRRMRDWPIDVERIAHLARRLRITDDGADMAETIDGPVNVCAQFWFPRPKHETKWQRQRIHHVGKPDLDKLLRGILDPMKKAGIYRDDSRVVSFQGSEKRYVDWGAGEPFADRAEYYPRVDIIVTRLAETR